jgi:hypothetical protein
MLNGKQRLFETAYKSSQRFTLTSPKPFYFPIGNSSTTFLIAVLALNLSNHADTS